LELTSANCKNFPLEAFLKIGFTHHRIILGKVKDLSERLFYIERCANEHFSVDNLNNSIANDDFHHQGNLPNNFRDKR
jgi:predicted nuclease of restriction endonuclease-like (RecB) superfamily